MGGVQAGRGAAYQGRMPTWTNFVQRCSKIMLSPADTVLIFVVALLLFGPEQVPKIARQLGDAMRHMQNSTSAFMAEMDRAAAATELKSQPTWEPPAASWDLPAGDGTTATQPDDAPVAEVRAEETPSVQTPDAQREPSPPKDEPTPPSAL